MALKDIFQKKAEKPAKKKKKIAVKAAKEAELRKEAKLERETEPVKEKSKQEKEPKLGRAADVPAELQLILKRPTITEKAADLAELNQYVFEIADSANKTRAKKAVEKIFGVDVVSVKIINIPAKMRRRGRSVGFRKGYKKAIIRIKEGQKIEVLPR